MALVGHYYMRGVMEVGSELRLQANGQFEYMLAYGALDEYATGCWSREGQTVKIRSQCGRPDEIRAARIGD